MLHLIKLEMICENIYKLSEYVFLRKSTKSNKHVKRYSKSFIDREIETNMSINVSSYPL